MTVNELSKRIKPAEHGGDGDPRLLVLGGGHVGHSVARSLATDGTVTFVDESDVVCRRAGDAIDSTVCGNPAEAEVLERVDAHEADTAVVATQADTDTFLATQLLRTRFDVEAIIARADDPELADVIGEKTDAVVTAPPVLAAELATAVERVTVPTARW